MLIEAQLGYLGLKPQIEFEIDGIASILELVHEGYGHTVLPLNSLRSHILGRDFLMSPITGPRLTIQLSLVTSAQRPTTPLARESLSLIRRTVSDVLFAEKLRTRAS
jgi:LysR family nitrogen assimilation transcriptional regulator